MPTWIHKFLEALAPGLIYLATSAPAWASADKCAGIADYTSWTECLRHEQISSDARLNLVYQKLIDKLRGNSDATNHLRDAQRRWIAFRDAQCALEGLATVGGSVHSTIVSGCLDRMAARRADDLSFVLTCQDGDPSCLKPASSGAQSETPRTEPAEQPQGAASSGIPFASPDVIENFKVSGVWFPEETVPYRGLSGHAIFAFSNINTGETFRAAINGVALLPEDFWEKHGVADSNRSAIATLVDKLRAIGVVKISLSPDTRAKVINCGSDARLPNEAGSQGGKRDRCLQLGDAAVDIQDIDFSGRKLFVFREAGQAQRGEDAYKVMELSYDNHLDDRDIGKPLNQLDQMSDINISKRQIILRESNGACEYAMVTYSANPQLGSGMRLVERRQYTTDPDGTCYIEDYVATKPSDDEGDHLKLRSRTLAK
jgi:uncharacterized protein YecT (DUF1311 family)